MYEKHPELDSGYNCPSSGAGCRAMGPGPRCNGRCAQYCARNRELIR